ncbi:hypothetical protein C0993_006138 [Termitomyces sp. T159_Od127]|nr:hypothetical protein C0993_006138 [Termitomyces sp. T159_Od127]
MMVVISPKGSKFEIEAKNAVLVVAFLLEDNVNDKLLDALVEAVASKVLEQVEPIVHHITSSLDFSLANNAAQVETTLALKEASTKLSSIVATLNEVVMKPASLQVPAPSQSPTQQPSWVDIAHPKQSPVPSMFNPAIPNHLTCLQQRLTHDAKTVLITVDPSQIGFPTEYTPATNYELWGCINKLLAKIDKSTLDLATTDRAYLLELDTSDLASRLQSYAHNSVWKLAKTCLGDSAWVIDKAHTLIFCFILCGGVFDPPKPEDILTLEHDNGITPGSISSAS